MDAPRNLDNMPRAIMWMLASGLSFALMGAMVKFAGDVALPAKVFLRNFVTLLITGSVAFRLQQNPFSPTTNWRRLLFRSLSGLAGVLLYFLAIERLHLADASLLNKTSPFFATIFAVVFLKEQFNRAMVPALIAAFAGAMLIIKPSFDGAPWPAIAGFGSGLFAGIAYVLVRSLKNKESPNRIILTFSLISCLGTLPFLVANPPQPTGKEWLALLGTGVFGAGGQYGLTFAFHHARASRISVFSYMHVLFALIIGFAFWGERPDMPSIAGGALIVGAAIWTHRMDRKPK
ncbi:MAG: drug/metabolite transporter (DMT)-like permease [Candidatus Krumholzibacteriia bacterium]